MVKLSRKPLPRGTPCGSVNGFKGTAKQGRQGTCASCPFTVLCQIIARMATGQRILGLDLASRLFLPELPAHPNPPNQNLMSKIATKASQTPQRRSASLPTPLNNEGVTRQAPLQSVCPSIEPCRCGRPSQTAP